MEAPCINGQVPAGLYGIRMKDDTVLAGDRGDFLNRLDGSDLVVGMHDGHEDCFPANRLAQLIRINQAVAVHGKVGNREATPFQELAGVENRVVFDRRGNEMAAFFLVRPGDLAKREVVRFGASGGENDLRRLSME